MNLSRVVRVALLFALPLSLPVLPAAASEGEGPKFLDRELLFETLTKDEEAPLAEAQEDLASAEAVLAAAEVERDAAQVELEAALADLATAESDLAATEAELADAQQAVDDAQAVFDEKQGAVDAAQADVEAAAAVVQAIEDEIQATADLIGELSDEQVFALNRSLHNAIVTGLLPLDIDSEYLEAILSGEYDGPQINAFIKAYEEEARFQKLAARFHDKAEASGDDVFYQHEERALAKAASQKEKFLELAERLESNLARAAARDAAHQAIAEERRDGARGAEKGKGHP